MKLIDIHSHVYWENGHDSGWEIPVASPGAIGPEVYLHAVRRSRLADGGRMVIGPGSGLELIKDDPTMIRRANEAAAELVSLDPELFILGVSPDPFHLDDSLALVEEWVRQRGARIIGEIVPYIGKYDREGPAMDAIYEQAVALDVPLNNHSSTPEDSAAVDRLASRHPNARIILAHVGGTWAWRQGVEVARRHDNVWLDTSGWVMVAGGSMEVALRELGASKFVFGIDYPLCDIDSWIARLERLPLSDSDRERIAWRNAAELMKLEV